MSDESSLFALTCLDDAPAPVLSGVAAKGRLDGVLFELSLRQTYRNTGDRNLEVVYTFPLPQQAVLLGFASELNGQRKTGTVVAKAQAERQYEEALGEGDAPVMLEALHGGLHTANIGNLKPGDELVIELRYAQTLMFEQGRLRLAIPTTIAPRYGDAELAGLQPQQMPQASITAEYPLTLAVMVARTVSGGSIECPTHRFARESTPAGVQLTLAQGAWLDRDVIILIRSSEAQPSLLVQAKDPVSNTVVRMAALQPPLAAERDHVAVKLLVDCSGSMGGSSIASAQAALRGVVEALRAGDQVSLSRFGSHVEHVVAPTTYNVARQWPLLTAIAAINADMGGTEMQDALRGVFALPLRQATDRADVLMITDGEIWQTKEMIEVAIASGHRVFAIGVGTSPAESVLRSLTEATGGACEFATPGEALEAAARRMLLRIRQPARSALRIDWGTKPIWQSTLPPNAFAGDTLIAFATFEAAATAGIARLMATDSQGEEIELARSEADALCPGDSLPRLAAARRITTADEPTALSLALQYQLLTDATNCILVHERAETDKAVDEAAMHRVSSMLAAGWGGLACSMELEAPACEGPDAPGMLDALYSAPPAPSPLPGRMYDMPLLDAPGKRMAASALEGEAASLRDIALAVHGHLASGGQIQGLTARCHSLPLHAELLLCLDQVVGLGLNEDQAFLLLAMWVNERHDGLQDIVITTTLQPWVEALNAALVITCRVLFAQKLSPYPVDGWRKSRSQRIKRAMAQPAA
jgi:Ca-activated chloride channel family protein